MGAVAGFAPPDNSTRSRGVQPLRAGKGHSFLWRKLHSLTGIVPIGAFLIEHIISNFEVVNGPLAYAQQVKFLNGLPLVRVLEWTLIFIPLLYHSLYGVFITFRGRSNVNVYPWAGNWAYIAQRVTGIIALAYIIQHVWRQRFAGVSLPEHPGLAYAKVQYEFITHPYMIWIYAFAMIATCWHFAYGIWLFAAKWGITPGDRARKKFGYVCGAVGTALCALGLVSIFWVVYARPYSPVDVMPAQPNGVVMPTVPLGKPTRFKVPSKNGHFVLAAYEPPYDQSSPVGSTPPTVKDKIFPRYPKELQENRASGTVTVEVKVAEDGTVKDLRFVSGPQDLKQVSVDAVSQWTFNPATNNGAAVEGTATVRIRFVPSDSKIVDASSADLVVGTDGRAPVLTRAGHIDPPPAGSVRVPPFDTDKLIVKKTKPMLPEAAKRAGVTGQVVLVGNIDKEGGLVKIDYLGGPPMLRDAAIESVRSWKFRPYIVDGEAKFAVAIFVVTFP